MSRCILRQCEEDAARADRYERAQEQTTKANQRADRAEGALDLCESKREGAQQRVIWLTVGNVVLGAAAAGATIWGATK